MRHLNKSYGSLRSFLVKTQDRGEFGTFFPIFIYFSYIDDADLLVKSKKKESSI